MPISSGANGWPGGANVIFLKTKAQQSTPQSPPPPYPGTQSQPRPIYHRYPHSSHPPPPRHNPPISSSNGCCGYENGCCGCSMWCLPSGSRCGGGPCVPEGSEPCCCFCGGSALYTTGVAGANAGCFQGGLFSSKV
jgi:hypothetical protein